MGEAGRVEGDQLPQAGGVRETAVRGRYPGTLSLFPAALPRELPCLVHPALPTAGAGGTCLVLLCHKNPPPSLVPVNAEPLCSQTISCLRAGFLLLAVLVHWLSMQPRGAARWE